MEPLTLAVGIAPRDSVDTDELAAVAARTFPLACPPSTPAHNIASFIDTNLSATRFAEYLADPRRAVLTARNDDRIVGYAMLIRGDPDDPDDTRAVDTCSRRRAVQAVRAARLSRCRRGDGVDGNERWPPPPNGACAACGSASIRKTNAHNAFTSRTALRSAAPERFEWAPVARTTTSWFASLVDPGGRP